MIFRMVLLTALFFGATVLAYSQETSMPPKPTVTTFEPKCDFSGRKPLRVWNLPANAVVKKVDPIYSQEARDAKVEGKVVLTVLVDRKGNVVQTCVEDGDPLLVPSAIDAVKQWKFKKHFGFSAKSYKSKKYAQTSVAITFRITESKQ